VGPRWVPDTKTDWPTVSHKLTSTSTSVYLRQLNNKSDEIVLEIFHDEVREAISENPEIF
jgi:hypothetical protein